MCPRRSGLGALSSASKTCVFSPLSYTRTRQPYCFAREFSGFSREEKASWGRLTAAQVPAYLSRVCLFFSFLIFYLSLSLSLLYRA